MARRALLGTIAFLASASNPYHLINKDSPWPQNSPNILQNVVCPRYSINLIRLLKTLITILKMAPMSSPKSISEIEVTAAKMAAAIVLMDFKNLARTYLQSLSCECSYALT
jgi:hypothetical protein